MANAVKELPVKFGSASVSKQTGKLGFSVDRSHISLEQAEALFVDRRLTVRLILGRNDDAEGQSLLIDEELEHRGVFDVKGFRVGTDMLTGLGLVTQARDMDLATIGKFRGGFGRLHIEKVEEIPEEKPEKPAKEDAAPMLFEGPWKEVSLDDLFDPKKATRKALAKAGINTVGELAALTAKGDFWAKDTPGIGPAKREEIEDRMIKFFADNPQYAEEAGSATPAEGE